MHIHLPSDCSCGKTHPAFRTRVITGAGVLRQLPELLRELGAERVFLLTDRNTAAAAGNRAEALLQAAGLRCTGYCFPEQPLHPDERTVGAAVMHWTPDCDAIVAVGSGVLNDTGKILAALTGRPYLIAATAPSMDGYASATSSMDRDGLKVSLPTRCADIILGDTDILQNAPMEMLTAGLGDMLAKYISLCEWKLASLITGEYYCPEVARLMRSALDTCVAHAHGLLRREPAAVEAVFQGLVLGGAAMYLAGVSRPASGVEHYFSHLWDMRALEFGTPAALHGTQCAAGTLEALRLYERLRTVTPDRTRALAHARAFDYNAWAAELRAFLGKGAEAMIALEAREGKYDPAAHAARLETILARWNDIRAIIAAELPPSADVARLMETLGMPDAAGLGIDPATLRTTFLATKDIRDKYVLSRLAWDLGVEEELVP